MCRRRDPEPGTHCCADCIHGPNGLAALIIDIERLHRALDPTPGSGGPTERRAPGFNSQSPARDEVLVLTDPRTRGDGASPDAVVNTLTGWAGIAAEDGPADPAHTVPDAAAELTRLDTLQWLAAQPWIDETHTDLTTSRHQLQRVLGRLEPTIPIGTCPTVLDLDPPEVCEGQIRARVWGETARCRACGRAWEGPEQLHQLARLLGDALADEPGIARYLNIAASTVRTWAQRDGWTPHRHGRRRLYSLAEARNSWARRHASPAGGRTVQ